MSLRHKMATSGWCHYFKVKMMYYVKVILMSMFDISLTLLISFCHQNDFDLPSNWCQNDVWMRSNWDYNLKIVSKKYQQRHQIDVYILHHFDFEIMTSSWCHLFMSKWHCQVTSFCHQNEFDLPSYWCQNDARMRSNWDQNSVKEISNNDIKMTFTFYIISTLK